MSTPIAHDEEDQFNRAIADFNKAIRLDPYEMTETRKHLAKARERRACRVNSLLVSGKSYVAGGEPDKAIREYDQALKLDPRYGICLVARGVAYACKGQYDRAVADFDRAHRVDPKSTRALDKAKAQKLRPGDTLTFYRPWGQLVSSEDRNVGSAKVGIGTVVYVTSTGDILITRHDSIADVWTKYEDVIWVDYARRWPDGDVMNTWVRLKQEP
jgi:tetratricopeptide (TPR) repeat protein